MTKGLFYLLIQTLKIYDIKDYENNPRNNDAAVEAVAASIQEFGFKVPIIIDKDNIIVAGHTRLKAAKKLGLDRVPCIVADDLTDEQVKAFRLADNKTAELAEWDFEKLESELFELAEMGVSMDDFGFDEFEAGEMPEIIEDDIPEVDEESDPITKRGQKWKLGNHFLLCGDATSESDVNYLCGGQKADLLQTDPPYNVDYEGKTEEELKIQNDKMDNDDFISLLTAAFTNADKNMKKGAAFYIWHASRTQKQFEETIPFEIRQQLIWNKNSMVLGRQDYQWKHEPCFYGWKEGAPHKWYSDRTQTTVLDFNKPQRNEDHPTMKPVELIAYQINNSTKQGDVVLDMFGGSGTTLIACEQLNRVCYMLELDPKYCDVIIKRWETLTGKKAELIGESK